MKTSITTLAVLVALTLLPAVCTAQEITDTAAQTPGAGIVVTGHADVQFQPDIAYLDISVVTQDRDQKAAARQNAGKASDVADALKKAGVAVKDIATQTYAIDPQYDYSDNKQVLTGYQVTNTVHVTIRDLGQAGVIVDAATRAGANQVGGLDYELQDRTGAEGQVLAQAVATARSKADLMAGAAGVRLGRLVLLTDNTQSAPRVFPVFNRAFKPANDAAQPTTPISTQTIDITADATAVYAIDYAKQ